MSKCKSLMMLVGVAAVQFAIAAPTVLKWTGEGGDWKFTTSANWSGDTSKFSDSTNGVSLDLTDVPDGSVLTNDFTAAGSCCITGVTLSAGRSITLQSPAEGQVRGWLRLLKGCTLNIPSGAQLVWGMNYPNDWKDGQSYMTADARSQIIVSGGGTLKITASVFCPYRHLLDVSANTTLVWDSPASAGSGLEMTVVRLVAETAKLELNRDMRVEAVRVWYDNAAILLNGHTLSNLSGDQGIYNNSSANLYRTPEIGDVTGGGTISFAGGALTLLRHSLSDPNRIVVANAAVDAGTSAAPVALPDGVEVSMPGTGRINIYRDQTIGGLSGDGVNGGLMMAAGKNLTVNGGGTYGARIAGGADFTKTGAASTLVLSGRNSYTGTTHVASGTLKVDAGAPTKRGAALHLGFEDSGAIMANTAYGAAVFEKKHPSQDPAADPLWPAQDTDGISGCAAVLSKTTKAYYELPASSRPVLAYTNGHPFTLAFWMKLDPANTYPNDMNYLFENGNWNAYKHFWVYLWKTGDVGFGYGDWNDVHNQTANGNHLQTALPSGYLSDGDWHQVAITYADRAMKIYVDVTNVVTKTLSQPLDIPNEILKIGGSGTVGYMPDCMIDELYICDRAWTAEEVAADGRREVEDPALDLPTPLAHWDFNDSENPGKDVGPHNLTLKRTDDAAYYCLAEKGAFGKAVSMMPSTFVDGYPNVFPTGSTAFTVSIRYRAITADDSDRYSYFGWGDNTVSGGYLQLNLQGSPRRDCIAYEAKSKSSLTLTDEHHTMVNDEGGWSHIVVTYDPATKELKCYREGTLVATKSNVELSIAAQKFYLGANANGYVPVVSHFDDVQIYDTALRADQVKLLVRSLETGRADTVLPKESPINVAAGARLYVAGDTHVFKSLSGGGEVAFENGASFLLEGGSAFAGTVSGNGLVRFASGASLKNASSVSADVRLCEDAVVSAESLPLASTTGDAWIPARGTVSLAGRRPAPGFYPIFSAARVHADGGLEGWSFAEEPLRYSAKLVVVDGVPGVQVGGGLIIVLR